MESGNSEGPSVGWWEGLGRHYQQEWRMTLVGCVGFAIAALGVWAYSVGPCAFDHVITTGTRTNVSCGSKGYSYTYSYSLKGVLYSGESEWGGQDGNPGHCSGALIGGSVRVTYNPIHPEQSFGGTIGDRLLSTVKLVALTSLGMAIFFVPLDYTKARRKAPSETTSVARTPVSRQDRRAMERREHKARKVE